MSANRRNFKSNKICSVPQCSNRASGRKVSLHSFPRCPSARKAWQYKLRIGKPITPSMRVCSEHFRNEDFMWSNADLVSSGPTVRHLKKNVVPSQKIPHRQFERTISKKRAQAQLAREERRARYSLEKDAACILHHECTNTQIEFDTEENEIMVEPFPSMSSSGRSTEEANAAEALLELASDMPECRSVVDRAIQVNTAQQENRKLRLTALLETDRAVNAFTGVPTKKLLVVIIQGVEKLETTVSQLSTEDRVVICLVKLKTNLTFSCLAVLFQTSEASVHRHFYGTLPVLAQVLQTAVIWPTKEQILKNMPSCFSDFLNVRVVADGTEVEIERTKCLRCRILTYSHYKGKHTVKFLVGVTPDGLLSFISDGFGGRASDKVTVEKSGLLKKLEPFEDAVMVDKGFHIGDECQSRALVMVQPPFLRKEAQFSPAQAVQTQKIAKARVHVERSIQRLKVFKLFKGPIPWELLSVIDDAMLVVTGIVNLSPPILGSDKFD